MRKPVQTTIIDDIFKHHKNGDLNLDQCIYVLEYYSNLIKPEDESNI